MKKIIAAFAILSVIAFTTKAQIVSTATNNTEAVFTITGSNHARVAVYEQISATIPTWYNGLKVLSSTCQGFAAEIGGKLYVLVYSGGNESTIHVPFNYPSSQNGGLGLANDGNPHNMLVMGYNTTLANATNDWGVETTITAPTGTSVMPSCSKAPGISLGADFTLPNTSTVTMSFVLTDGNFKYYGPYSVQWFFNDILVTPTNVKTLCGSLASYSPTGAPYMISSVSKAGTYKVILTPVSGGPAATTSVNMTGGEITPVNVTKQPGKGKK